MAWGGACRGESETHRSSLDISSGSLPPRVALSLSLTWSAKYHLAPLPQRGSMFVARATTRCRLQRSRMCPRSDALHWARSFRVFPTKTYCSSGARGTSDGPFYKHTAPLGQPDPMICDALQVSLLRPALRTVRRHSSGSVARNSSGVPTKMQLRNSLAWRGGKNSQSGTT